MKKANIQRTPWITLGCSSRCYMAGSDKKKCKCKCHGEHHGIGRQAIEEKAKQEKLEVEEGGQHEDDNSKRS